MSSSPIDIRSNGSEDRYFCTLPKPQQIMAAEIIDLTHLDFGAPAAERDMSHGLREYFVESPSFSRFKDGKKTVLLGNRGSGKSAIFKMLAENERTRGHLVIELAPEEYSYEILNTTLAKERDGSWSKQGAYAAAWKFLIYVVLMKQIINNYPNLKKNAGKRIFTYLRDNHHGIEKSPLEALISYLKRLEGFKIGNYEASIKTRELQRLYKIEEISELLPELKAICDKYPVTVFVDELDKGWDASEDAKAFVAGLFQAALSINNLTPKLRVLISLRKELYDNIPTLYEDAQKVWDLIEVIEWDEPSLFTMITKRIGHSLQSTQDLLSDQQWHLVFSETLDFRQTKSFNYMIDRTLYRPREIIQFCTDAKEKAIASNNLPPIDYQTLSEAEIGYSENRTKDIAAEYRFQYPGLLSIFESFRGKLYNFDRADLEYHCLGISCGEVAISSDAAWALNQDTEFLINILWQVGFLRAQTVGGLRARRRSGSSYLGPHQVANLSLSGINRFHVHPMFRTYLGLKEKERKS